MRPSFIEMTNRNHWSERNRWYRHSSYDKPRFKVGDIVYAKEIDGNINVFGVITNEPPHGTLVYESNIADEYRFGRRDKHWWLGVDYHYDHATTVFEEEGEEAWQMLPYWNFSEPNDGILAATAENEYNYFVRWVPNSGNSSEQEVCNISIIREGILHKAPDFISKLRESVKRTKQRKIELALVEVINCGLGLDTITTKYITKTVWEYCWEH